MAEADDPIAQLNALSPSRFISTYLPPSSPEFTIRREGAEYGISVRNVIQMKSVELEQCFRLIEETSKSDYKHSSRGWKPSSKRREMREDNMWYLLLRIESDGENGSADRVATKVPQKRDGTEEVKDSQHSGSSGDDGAHSPILAFLSFMLTYEDDYPVLYIYEIHLSDILRRSGIGGHLMNIVETVASRTGAVEKLMLSVFTRNQGARAFYSKQGYEIDEYSPREKRLRSGVIKEPDYEILSKMVKREVNKEIA
jgi:N-alpha-acetyltransferase 40